MKTVPLHGKHGAGRVALVDDADYGLVSQYRWTVQRAPNTLYVVRNWHDAAAGRSRQQAMHQLLTGFAITDHENHNGLDNRRENLRDGSGGGNQRNTRKVTPRTSQFKGVFWNTEKQKWEARISVNGQAQHLGRYDCEERAARAYDAAARAGFGAYAWLNFPDLEGDDPDSGLWPPERSRSNAAKTHCKRGHEFTPENTYPVQCKNGTIGRGCKQCRRDGKRERYRERTGASPRGDGDGYVAAKVRRESPAA